MRRVLTHVSKGFVMAAFAVLCLTASPFILFHLGVSAVRDRIESRWPESERARAVSFWLGFLAPVVLFVVLAVLLGFAISRVRALKQAATETAPDPP